MLQRVHAREEDGEGQGWKQDVQPRRNKEGEELGRLWRAVLRRMPILHTRQLRGQMGGGAREAPERLTLSSTKVGRFLHKPLQNSGTHARPHPNFTRFISTIKIGSMQLFALSHIH